MTDRFWNKTDTKKYLVCCERKVDYLRANDGLPWFKVGSSVRFDPAAVRQWAEAKQQGGGADA